MFEKSLKKLSLHKTFVFLVMCLLVHVFNVAFYSKIGIEPLVTLNCVSAALYVVFLTFFRKNEDLQIVFAYFEIVGFSLISECISGGNFDYIYYVVGMVAVVFFLLPTDNKYKHVYQFIGVIFAIGIGYIDVVQFFWFPEYKDVVLEWKNVVSIINLVITMFTLFYISNLYLLVLKATRDKLTFTSNHDQLTGLYNRRFFENIMKRSKEEKERVFSVAMIDVDDFKKINDNYGHEAGDKVLELVSWCIKECLPPNAVAVRWGGEEFILYLPLSDDEETCFVMERIRSYLKNRTVNYKGQKIAVTVTIGVCAGDNISNYEAYIRKADEMLYWGKNHGKNQIVNTVN